MASTIKAMWNTLNKLIGGTDYEGLTLKEIIRETEGKVDKTAIFNNAAPTSLKTRTPLIGYPCREAISKNSLRSPFQKSGSIIPFSASERSTNSGVVLPGFETFNERTRPREMKTNKVHRKKYTSIIYMYYRIPQEALVCKKSEDKPI